MYRHPEARYAREDDACARDSGLVLQALMAKAAQRVPEWSPELRAKLREVYRKTRSRYIY